MRSRVCVDILALSNGKVSRPSDKVGRHSKRTIREADKRDYKQRVGKYRENLEKNYRRLACQNEVGQATHCLHQLPDFDMNL
jgi:hypothetical protein